MDKKLIAICVLTVTAAFLMLANFIKPAHADESVANRDYSVVTARVQGGGEGIYIIDNRTGLLAIFYFDPTTRSIVPRAVRPVSDAFR